MISIESITHLSLKALQEIWCSTQNTKVPCWLTDRFGSDRDKSLVLQGAALAKTAINYSLSYREAIKAIDVGVILFGKHKIDIEGVDELTLGDLEGFNDTASIELQAEQLNALPNLSDHDRLQAARAIFLLGKSKKYRISLSDVHRASEIAVLVSNEEIPDDDGYVDGVKSLGRLVKYA